MTDSKQRFRTEREADGRWLAEDLDHPGVMAYGKTPAEAEVAVRELAERVAPTYTNRHGQRCSDACGEGRHAECTETLDTCHCTYRGLHKTMHAYATIPQKPEVAERVAEKCPTCGSKRKSRRGCICGSSLPTQYPAWEGHGQCQHDWHTAPAETPCDECEHAAAYGYKACGVCGKSTEVAPAETAEQRLAGIKEYLSKMTPGPWDVGRWRQGNDSWSPMVAPRQYGAPICHFSRFGAPEQDKADAHGVAHLRTDAEWLVDYALRLEREHQVMREALEKISAKACSCMSSDPDWHYETCWKFFALSALSQIGKP